FQHVTSLKEGNPVEKKLNLDVRKNTHVLIAGPNGIGKTTLLEKIAQGAGDGFDVAPEAVIGYYKQDFGNLDYDKTAYQTLSEVMEDPDDEHMLRSTAAGFLLDGALLSSEVSALSEGQKGLLSFCRLVLLRPSLLVLDEPTNHINFRHLPIIAKALDAYQGALVMVSHIPEFVSQVRIDEVIDLADV
ncbi:MAG: ATP-binding cassette domain-containing protein, partial [bacterium]|nr:ATP-binding cassette domain-containing protein [bacterium]